MNTRRLAWILLIIGAVLMFLMIAIKKYQEGHRPVEPQPSPKSYNSPAAPAAAEIAPVKADPPPVASVKTHAGPQWLDDKGVNTAKYLLGSLDPDSGYLFQVELISDAAAVTLLTSDEGPGSLIDIQCATAGKHHGKFIIPAGGCRLPHSEETRAATTDKNGNVRTPEDIHMDGMGILAFVNSMVPRQVKTMLEQNNLTTEETDLFIFHQASKLAVDSLARCLRLDGDKLFRNIAEIGNTVSSSIPIALKEALEMKRVCSGSTVLLCGFGVGLSWGTALIRIP